MRRGSVRVAKDDRPIRRLSRALALPLVLGWIGCAALDRGQTLVPTRHQTRTGQFLLLSNFPMTDDSPAVRCLHDLERDLGHHMGFRPPAAADPVEIYVLDDQNAFEHFLKFYFPELPHRRAFFLAQGSERVIYTYASPRLEEDLRHEATHAELRGAFGDLPLWLDEGLAEYFETDLSLPEGERPRLEQIAADLRGGWSPNLERLESLTDIRQMTQRDYREAWGWVHLLLNGPEPGKSLLIGYLKEPDRSGDKARLSPQFAHAKITNERLLAHLKALPTDAVATKTRREAGTPRLQDGPIDPRVTDASRGIWHRFRTWIGL
jgi:hypothetical protein